MNIRDRFLSLIYRSLCCVIALAFIIVIFITSPAGSFPEGIFYIQALVVLLVGFLLKAIFNAIDLYKHGRVGIPAGIWMPFSLAFLSYGITGCALCFISNSYYDLSYIVIRFVASTLVPLLYLIDYLLFEEKGTATIGHPLYWSIYPILYGAIVLISPYITGYEVSFVNLFSARYFALLNHEVLSSLDGYAGVAISYCTFVVAFIILGYLILLVDHLLGQRFKRQARELY